MWSKYDKSHREVVTVRFIITLLLFDKINSANLMSDFWISDLIITEKYLHPVMSDDRYLPIQYMLYYMYFDTLKK